MDKFYKPVIKEPPEDVRRIKIGEFVFEEIQVDFVNCDICHGTGVVEYANMGEKRCYKCDCKGMRQENYL